MLKAVTAKEFKPVSRVHRFLEQGRNYTALVWWLVHSVFKGRMRLLGISITLNLLHLSSQAAAIYIIYWYAKQMEGKGVATIPYLDYAVDLKTQPGLLFGVVIASVFFFVVSATLFYISRKLVFDIAQQQYGRSMERLVLDGRDLPDPRSRLASRLLVDFGFGGLSTGCRRGALLATAFANAIAAVIGATGASIFLIRVDLPLTVLIIVSVGVAALFLYPLTLRAVRLAQTAEKAQAAFKEESRTIFTNRNSENPPQAMPSAHTLAGAFLARRRVLTEFVFAIEIGVTIILGVVVFYMASQAFSGREQWAIFIAYIGALRIVLSGCTAAIQVFANVSRFYPRIVRYYLFVKDVAKINDTELAKLKPGNTIVLGTLESGPKASVTVGERIALLTIDPVQTVMYALIDAKSPDTRAPIGVQVIDSVGISKKDGAIALVALNQLEDLSARLEQYAETLKNKAVLIAYTSMEKIGSCGEEKLLTIANGELRRFVPLGTPEAEAAIREIALLAKKRRAYEDEEDEEVE